MLLELGTALAENRLAGRTITVGADHGYPRRPDLELQIRLAVPSHTLHRTLTDTVATERHRGYVTKSRGHE